MRLTEESSRMSEINASKTSSFLNLEVISPI